MRHSRTFLVVLAALVVGACDSGDGIPRGVEIDQIVVDDTPLLRPDGERWDGGLVPSGPDVYVLLLDSRGQILVNTDDEELNRDPFDEDGIGNYSDVGPDDFPLVWDLDPAFYLPGVDRIYEIVVKDDDPTTTDDDMAFTGQFTFNAGDGRVDVSDSVVLTSADGLTSVRARFRLVD